MLIRKMITEEDTEQVASLYQEVWNSSPEMFMERLKRHEKYPGFLGVVAVIESDIVGFAYGYHSIAGQYYHELIKKALSPIKQKLWLADCFEFVELAVHSSYRQQSIGRGLVTELIEKTSKKTAMLTTQMNNVPAGKIYKKTLYRVQHQRNM